MNYYWNLPHYNWKLTLCLIITYTRPLHLSFSISSSFYFPRSLRVTFSVPVVSLLWEVRGQHQDPRKIPWVNVKECVLLTLHSPSNLNLSLTTFTSSLLTLLPFMILWNWINEPFYYCRNEVHCKRTISMV